MLRGGRMRFWKGASLMAVVATNSKLSFQTHFCGLGSGRPVPSILLLQVQVCPSIPQRLNPVQGSKCHYPEEPPPARCRASSFGKPIFSGGEAWSGKYMHMCTTIYNLYLCDSLPGNIDCYRKSFLSSFPSILFLK